MLKGIYGIRFSSECLSWNTAYIFFHASWLYVDALVLIYVGIFQL